MTKADMNNIEYRSASLTSKQEHDFSVIKRVLLMAFRANTSIFYIFSGPAETKACSVLCKIVKFFNFQTGRCMISRLKNKPKLWIKFKILKLTMTHFSIKR